MQRQNRHPLAPALFLGISLVIGALACVGGTHPNTCTFPPSVGAVHRPTATPCAGACATALPTCEPLPVMAISPTPPPIPACDPSMANNVIQQLTWTEANEQLVDVAIGRDGQNAALYLRDGALIMDSIDQDSFTVEIGQATTAHLAFGLEQVALLRRLPSGTWVVNTTGNLDNVMGTITRTTTITPPVTGFNLLAAYGPEGWLHIVAPTHELRYNPFSNTWEDYGSLSGVQGEALQLTTTADGHMLLLTTTGLYRREFDEGGWALALDASAIQAYTNSTPETISTFAVLENRVGVAWLMGAGNNIPSQWKAMESPDAGNTWISRQTAVTCLGNECGQVFPGFRWDTAFMVIGAHYTSILGGGEGKGDLIQAYWSPSLSAWCPNPNTTSYASILNTYVTQPLGTIRAASANGRGVIAFEMIQFNGRRDIYGIAY